jgi:hypothetical protein
LVFVFQDQIEEIHKKHPDEKVRREAIKTFNITVNLSFGMQIFNSM